jgi:succinate-acetate transporter protein
MTQMIEHWTKAGPISHSPNVELEEIERMEARAAATVGEPAPLGLLGFATATFTLSTVLAGWYPMASAALAIPVVLIFGGLAQFIAALFSLRKGDTFAATAFGSFGSFNTAYAILVLLTGHLLAPATNFGPEGIFICCFGFIAFFLALAALRRNMALVLVLGALALAYACDGGAFLANQNDVILHIGGWAGIVSSVLAFYTAMGMVLNSNFGRTIVPLGAYAELSTKLRS